MEKAERLVSVIMPAYNCVDYIGKSIAFVFGQASLARLFGLGKLDIVMTIFQPLLIYANYALIKPTK